MFTKTQFRQIENLGITTAQIEQQLQMFIKGIPYTKVVAAATRDNGIETLNETEQKELAAVFEEKSNELKLVKFVPASGAATRMFQSLNAFLNRFNPEETEWESYLQQTENKDVKLFFDHLPQFAFAEQLTSKIAALYPDYVSFSKGKQACTLVKTLLEEEGLDFNNMPKGLIPFHRYNEKTVTAFEEQLTEAALYASSKGKCRLHFTVSENHLQSFQEEYSRIKQRVEEKTGCTYHISYSFQKTSTDTIAVTPDNKPFEDAEGNLVFRPSGHGALIENLNETDADIIFIKNIDNVVVESEAEKTAFHKKILAGKLLRLQSRIFDALKSLENPNVPESVLREIKDSLEAELKNIPNSREELIRFLNRPVRVCGMVKNTGAPGGGPFWVEEKGSISKQIVELSQIDISNPQQKEIVSNATHFNPVDLVCGIKNYKGEKFDLTRFTNPDAAFISEKSVNGIPIKALELPGLWNGAMANWITVFAEVPLYTFNPVKTVNDLLKETHQSR